MSYTLEEVKDIIRNKINHEVISKEYISARNLLDIKCICGVVYQKSLKTINSGFYHCNGKRQLSKKISIKEINCSNPKCNKLFKPNNSKGKFCSIKCSVQTTQTKEYMIENGIKIKDSKKTIICIICKEEFKSKYSTTKLCSLKCAKINEQTDDYKEKAILNGQKAGKVSATSQQRRSKNEVCFAELCESYFGKENVVCNVPIFNGWDADVIILSRKIAILWNGIFHYKQIMKSQSLKQVQARDKIKWDVIIKNGYTPYEIKDMGKHDPKFVKQEFEAFLLSLVEV
jgi:hypothetical protein